MAIVINTSWNIFNFRIGLMNALVEEGYRVVAIAPRDEYSERIEDAGYEYHDIAISNKGTNPLEDIKLIYAFYKLYKEVAPDIVLEYTIKPNIYGSMAAKRLGIPVINSITGLGTVFLNEKFSSKIARQLYRVALATSKRVFFQNIHDRDLFVRMGFANRSKTEIIAGSGIDTEKFKPSKDQADNDDTFHFLFIARLLKDKGLIEYVRAAEQIKNGKAEGRKCKFSILGSYYPGNPTAITEVEMKKWEKDNIITYLGTSDNVASFISEADCIVLPSYREGLSRVLLEAASMSKPIITSDVPGCREVVVDGVNGYLCEARDSDSLAEQVEKILNLSEEEHREFGKKGREKVLKEFDEKIIIEKYLEVIKQILHPDGH